MPYLSKSLPPKPAAKAPSKAPATRGVALTAKKAAPVTTVRRGTKGEVASTAQKQIKAWGESKPPELVNGKKLEGDALTSYTKAQEQARSIEVDGNFGGKSTAALKAMQSVNGKKADGILGAQSKAFLEFGGDVAPGEIKDGYDVDSAKKSIDARRLQDRLGVDGATAMNGDAGQLTNVLQESQVGDGYLKLQDGTFARPVDGKLMKPDGTELTRDGKPVDAKEELSKLVGVSQPTATATGSTEQPTASLAVGADGGGVHVPTIQRPINGYTQVPGGQTGPQGQFISDVPAENEAYRKSQLPQTAATGKDAMTDADRAALESYQQKQHRGTVVRSLQDTGVAFQDTQKHLLGTKEALEAEAKRAQESYDREMAAAAEKEIAGRAAAGREVINRMAPQYFKEVAGPNGLTKVPAGELGKTEYEKALAEADPKLARARKSDESHAKSSAESIEGHALETAIKDIQGQLANFAPEKIGVMGNVLNPVTKMLSAQLAQYQRQLEELSR